MPGPVNQHVKALKEIDDYASAEHWARQALESYRKDALRYGVADGPSKALEAAITKVILDIHTNKEAAQEIYQKGNGVAAADQDLSKLLAELSPEQRWDTFERFKEYRKEALNAGIAKTPEEAKQYARNGVLDDHQEAIISGRAYQKEYRAAETSDARRAIEKYDADIGKSIAAERHEKSFGRESTPELRDHFRVGDVRVVGTGGDNVRIEKHQVDGQVYGVDVCNQDYQSYIIGDKQAAQAFPELTQEEIHFVTTHETPAEQVAKHFGEDSDWTSHAEGRGQEYGMEP